MPTSDPWPRHTARCCSPAPSMSKSLGKPSQGTCQVPTGALRVGCSAGSWSGRDRVGYRGQGELQMLWERGCSLCSQSGATARRIRRIPPSSCYFQPEEGQLFPVASPPPRQLVCRQPGHRGGPFRSSRLCADIELLSAAIEHPGYKQSLLPTSVPRGALIAASFLSVSRAALGGGCPQHSPRPNLPRHGG
jgi:hypothetical protein